VASSTLDTQLLESYIFLSSCHALLEYINTGTGTSNGSDSLKIEVNFGYGGRLVIDRQTVKHLELMTSTYVKSGHSMSIAVLSIIALGSMLIGAQLVAIHVLISLMD